MHLAINALHNGRTAGFFVHTSLLAGVIVTKHQNTEQHSTDRKHMSSGCWGAGEYWMTVHTRRTQVTLHYSLLFHCLISQRLINMHAFPESDMMRAAFLQMQVYRHAYRMHSETMCNKKVKGGTFLREITHQILSRF